MQTQFAVIGSGWRAEFFLRVARLCPEEFAVCGVVTRNAEKAARITAAFVVPCFAGVDELLAAANPEFAVVSVSKPAAMGVSLDLLRRGVPVLAETPPADSTAQLLEFHRQMPAGAKYQVAEQYFLRPDHLARLAFAATGKLGEIVQARISLTNNYHAISLMRKYLGVGFAPATITATRFTVPGIPGFSRTGPLESEQITQPAQTLAVLDFGGKQGIYDYEDGQHRSWIRSQQVLIKGVRGEIDNLSIRYLLDHRTPMEAALTRKNLGEVENLEGCGLKGYLADGAWYYRNPFPDSRMTDDEIAVAECMRRMAEHAHGGPEFYGFDEAAQDYYLTEKIEEAVHTGQAIRAERQPWGEV